MVTRTVAGHAADDGIRECQTQLEGNVCWTLITWQRGAVSSSWVLRFYQCVKVRGCGEARLSFRVADFRPGHSAYLSSIPFWPGKSRILPFFPAVLPY